MSTDTPRSLDEIIAAKRAQDEANAKQATHDAEVRQAAEQLWKKASNKFNADYVSTIGIADQINQS